MADENTGSADTDNELELNAPAPGGDHLAAAADTASAEPEAPVA
ncbi:hypothetical protein [Microbacterium sp.]